MPPPPDQTGESAAVTIDRLARIETKLDGIRDERGRTEDRLDTHGRRLDRVERFMWLALGMAAASGAPEIIRYVTAGSA